MKRTMKLEVKIETGDDEWLDDCSECGEQSSHVRSVQVEVCGVLFVATICPSCLKEAGLHG